MISDPSMLHFDEKIKFQEFLKISMEHYILDRFLYLNPALNPPVTWHLSFVSKT